MEQNKKTYISMLNVISALAVVLLHMSGFWSFSPPVRKGWVLANLIETVFYFAVPIFFMISGATLINYREKYSTKQFFKKRFAKTFIPFIFWSVFGLIFIICQTKDIPSDLNLFSFFNSIINCKYTTIYWFFPALFSVYFAIPVLSAIPNEKRKGVFGYAIIIGFILNSLLPFVFSFTNGKINHNYAFNMPMASGYIIFVLIGYYVDNYEIKKPIRLLIYTLGIIGLLVHFFGTWYLTEKAGTINSFFKGYTAPPCLLYSSAIFIFFKYFDFAKMPNKIIKIITYFRGQTFGVYLIHIYLIRLYTNNVVIDFKGYSYLYSTVGAIIVFCYADS